MNSEHRPIHPLGWVRLKGLRAEGARVGVYPHERKNPWPIVVDVALLIPVQPSAQSEQLEDTIDYDQVAHLITELCRSRHFNLIETLAEEIASRLLRVYKPKRVNVEVHKHGILGGATASVEVERGL